MNNLDTKNTVAIRLGTADILQILDALADRAEAWEKTEAVLNNGFESEDIFFVPEECDDSSEAAEISQHFRDIISTIESQLTEHHQQIRTS